MPETPALHPDRMFERITRIPGGGVAHYVVGGAYVLAHLATFGIRVRTS